MVQRIDQPGLGFQVADTVSARGDRVADPVAEDPIAHPLPRLGQILPPPPTGPMQPYPAHHPANPATGRPGSFTPAPKLATLNLPSGSQARHPLGDSRPPS